ncbi:MAG: hypothetical protein P1V35_04765, partial [Planctomycetota bacterium]|nr:hypothetical protein [Planctomycetota bacterium]
MKRIALAILVLTPLLPTFAFAQAEQPQKEHLKMQINELKQQLNASHYASENLRRELDALVERNHQQQDEIQSRMLAAIEAELKATLEKDSVLKQMAELEARFNAVNLDVRGRLAEVEQQRQSLENEVAQLHNRLSQSKSESHNLEADLKTAIYISKYMEGRQLAILAGQAFGDRVTYSQLDPISSHATGGFRQRFTSIAGGNHVLVTDFPDQLKKALDLLIEIDASFMQESQTATTEAKPAVVVYHPKALEAYEVIEMLSHSFASRDSSPNMSEMPGTGAVRIEGSEADVKEALAQLKANDQFPAQVRIRAFLVHTESDPNTPEITLPKKLV